MATSYSPEAHFHFISSYLGELEIAGEKLWVYWAPGLSKDEPMDLAIYQYLMERNADLVLYRKSPPEVLAKLFDRRLIFYSPNLGKPVDFSCFEDKADTARFLACFHRTMYGFNPEPVLQKNTWNLIARWEGRKKRLQEFLRIAEHRRVPGSVDRFICDNKFDLIDQVDKGIHFIIGSPYLDLLKCQESICLYHYKTEYFWRIGQKITAWTFAACTWDIPVVDLYRYIIHLTSDGGYSEDNIERIIDAYEEMRPMSKEEKLVLKALFSFPDRLYRIISSYYLSRKECSVRNQYQRLINEWERCEERTMKVF